MNKYTSTEITEDTVTPHPINEEITLSFDIAKGTETVSIQEPLITNFAVAEERARSVFLDSSYTTKRLTFETYHIDGLALGNIIEIDATLFIIQSITDTIVKSKASMRITCERWE